MSRAVDEILGKIDRISIESYDAGQAAGYERGLEDGYYNGYNRHPYGEYLLYMDFSPHDPQFICGHNDPLWLLERAQLIAGVIYDGMNDSIRFRVQRVLDGSLTSSVEFGSDGILHWQGSY